MVTRKEDNPPATAGGTDLTALVQTSLPHYRLELRTVIVAKNPPATAGGTDLTALVQTSLPGDYLVPSQITSR